MAKKLQLSDEFIALLNNTKNIITASGTSNFTTSTTDIEKIELTTTTKVGDKLSISNGGVLIGSGVSYVKISGTIMFQTISGSGQRHNLYIRNNNTNILSAISRLSGTWEVISTMEIVIPVQKNNIIYLYVRSQDGTGATINGGSSRLTVEVVK